jgi:hypothetical protein
MTPEEADKLNLEAALENGDALAFPFISKYETQEGLTKREYMATQLMSGLLSHGHDTRTALEYSVKSVDLLLVELNKNK